MGCCSPELLIPSLHPPFFVMQTPTAGLDSIRATQYQLLGWPVEGVPKFGACITELIKTIRKSHSHGPILVHSDNDAIGRIGVLITLDSMLEVFQEGNLNVYDFVKRICAKQKSLVKTQVKMCIIIKKH